ncbi:MAG: adenosylhomocysteinase, partial [Oscillospiraceae bacterium]
MSIYNESASAESGLRKIKWAESFMPVMRALRLELERDLPFSGIRITMSIHLEAKTAVLALALRAGGAEVALTGCNILSTQDDVAAALARYYGLSVFARRGVSETEYKAHLKYALGHKPHLIIDDGGDLVSLLCSECSDLRECLIGGCEETTTGVRRLRARAAANALPFPMVNVNDAKCKHYFDNKYGTGQSVADALMHLTNLLIAGKTAVVAGYGYCGRGIALRLKGMGADVIVTETDPFKALEATMENYRVMTMDEAAPLGDIFVTATGCRDVITARHFDKMKDGALLCNAGHFNVEV